MPRELFVLLERRIVGKVRQDSRGHLRFAYLDDWRHADDAYPLSLSMPLAAAEHEDDVVSAYLWGLLPDNELILERWARQWRISARNPLALLGRVGEECAGAVQLVTPDRVESVLSTAAPAVEWLTAAEVAERLRQVRLDPSRGRREGDAGQFSLPGAQPKTALHLQGDRWGVPSGRVPTTHILKPPTGELDGHAENEHFCLQLAAELGLVSARSEVRRFDGELALVVERYDRQWVGTSWVRVHQEDMCQALGCPPMRKYENQGGPGIATIIRLLDAYSSAPSEDRARFIDAVIFNWLIGGTDGHAKNYSVLIGGAGQVRLAPLYDVASALGYPAMDPLGLDLAMRIGGRYRLGRIGPREWDGLAEELKLPPGAVEERILGMARRIPESVSRVAERLRAGGVDHPILARLEKALAARSNRCEQVFAGAHRG